MCGIGGKLSFGDRPDPEIAEAMNRCLVHRGPDAGDVYASRHAVLAHRRLSIIDLGDAGRQPMSNADGTVHIVFNGEIYNYRELRERVDGYSFRSETDTEVLLHLYEEFGRDCLSMLRGMFSFAIWDETESRLFAAVDRLGQKPFYYREGDETFWFGSTIKAILTDDAVSPSPDTDALQSYLTYQYVPRPQTGFETIERLEPGTCLTVDEDGVRRDRYWDLSPGDTFTDSPSELASRLRDKLREATALRMRSDVPVGVFLSGGLDSAIVTSLMDDLTDERISTYSIGFDVEAFDELEFARSVASEFDTDHHEYTVSPDSMDVLPEIVDHYEMPFGDPSALPTYYVSQVASEDVTVALTGDAGDENFAGYDRYTYDRIATRIRSLPRTIRRVAESALWSVPDVNKRVTDGRRMLRAANGDPTERYAEFICRGRGEEFQRVWDDRPDGDELANLRAAFASVDGDTRLDDVLRVDLRTYLPDDLLVKVDRASMAHSIEVRSPFLDHELVEFASRIPAKYKYRRGSKKWILKRAFERDLPDDVVHRSKQGFGVPVGQWFRGRLRDDLRESLERLGDRPGFDRRELLDRFDDHVSKRRDIGLHLWDLFFLEKWFRRFVDRY